MANLAISLLLLTGLASCGVQMPVTIKAPRNTQVNPVDEKPGNVRYLEGQWTSTDSTVVDLAAFRAKPTILVFAQDTCAVCRKESLAMKASLSHPSTSPNQINLFTVIVGSAVEDARDWKDELQIPWTVGADPKSELFRKLCATPTVPCLLVQLPSRGIVLATNGEVSLSELVSLTGPWEKP